MRNSLTDRGPTRRARSLWKFDDPAVQLDVTVPVHLAYCGIAAALRRQVRIKTSSLAVLAVEASDGIDSYVHAARLFLRQQFAGQEYRDPFVRVINQRKNEKPSELEIFRRAAENGRGILLCDALDNVDEELRLFADVVASISKPTLHQINATFRRCGHILTRSEEDMIASETWTRLVYAFQPDRPVLVGLRRLRATPKKPPTQKSESVASGPALTDLYGLGEAGDWGLELARDLRDYRNGLITWSEVDAGLLLSGAPGTGKTLFAAALAKTCGLPIVTASAAQWQSAGHLNDFLKAMKSAFEEARSKTPCLLFIDEIDSFGSRGISDSQNSDYKRQVINGLLEMLDGFQRRSGVIVIGATNYPENLDPAITRAGRLDRHIVIPLPDEAARLEILKHYAGFAVPSSVQARFGRSTVGFSGADIKQMVRDARRVARRVNEALHIGHVLDAARPLVKVPSEHMRMAAIHETGHAIVGVTLGLQLEGISISDTVVTDGPDMLGGASFSGSPFTMRTRTHYLNRLTMLLAGIAAETVVFGEFTDGGAVDAHSDLARATALATEIEACLGFGDTFVVELVEERELSRLRSMNPTLRLAVQKLLKEAFDRATSLLQKNANSLQVISDMLLRHHQLAGSAVEHILRGSSGKSDDPLGYDTSDPQYPLQAASEALSHTHEEAVKGEIADARRRWGMSRDG